MDVVNTISLTMGAAWASGINLYATLFVLGYLNLTGNINLPPDLQVLSNPLILGAAALMYCAEFFADKIPGVDSAWDTLHTFIRIPAGAILASQAVGDVNPAVGLGAVIVGGSLAATTHALKAGSRVLINTSPEPFTNWGASLSEDIMVIGGLWTALHYPWVFLLALMLFIVLMIWVLPKLWGAILRVFSAIGRLLTGKSSASPP
jgi:hypothetical protein